MSLKDKFQNIKPRENAGSIASNRFDFQKNWAICKLIELLSNNSDFLLAFEYHEDIVILDSSDSPCSIDFFQVKTKDKGNYTLNELLKKKKNKSDDGNSILGKLITNKLNFDNETKTLNLVTNTRFKLSSSQDSKMYFCCNELSDIEKEEIEKQLKSEIGSGWLSDFLNIIFFHSSELTIEHHNEITKDRLNKLIENLYSSDVKYNPSLAYRTIFDEVNRRNNLEKPINNFEELIKYKAISKQDFEKMLKIVVSEPNRLDTLKNRIFNSLDSSGISIFQRKKFVEAWKDVEVQYLTVDNEYFGQCVEIIKKSISNNLEKLDVSLLKCLDVLFADIMLNKKIKEQKIYSEYFLKMTILKELYDE
ncbi:dsDNA nuclease domain-containing protein [Riemerella anatipestifer]|uniref:dsDNA nuclease domain-containing protein n=1 Tax=Riemerella anatipestifer TaxID=34085 RepID=UPI002A89ABA3|nr:dsDNA nuclease domain-containing protein [Riemerella anatipestifer]